MAEAAVDALRRHAVERSERKHRAVVHAIHAIQSQGEPVTVSAVARAAGVSREFIHSHPDLHRAVRAAARHARATARTPRAAESGAGLRAERSTLLAQIDKHRATIKTLRTQVEDLEDQRRRWLGSQLTDLAVDPDTHAALRRDNDRLTSQNRALQQGTRRSPPNQHPARTRTRRIAPRARRTRGRARRRPARERTDRARRLVTRVSEYYHLGRTQPTLDFVDVDVRDDIRVFLDPRALLLLHSPWGEQCRDMVHTFFTEVLRAVAARGL